MNAQHFNAAEYREWSDDMSPRLVTMMDVLRFMSRRPIEISASPYALGRELGPDDLSAHNVDRWGEVLANDCFVSGVYCREQAESIVDLARRIGFTGIGVSASLVQINRSCPAKRVLCHLKARPPEQAQTAPGEL